jgi:O-antigen biosynthesis protein
MSAPLISCIMPTHGRAALALQAVRLFQRQDYPARELIIVDDGVDTLAGRLPDDPRVRYLLLDTPRTIAEKRNLACELASGPIIAQWDDDDWYGVDRLSAQVAPLLAGQADIAGLRGSLIGDLDRWAFWHVTPDLHRRMYVGDIHGGTLMFWRAYWEQGARYPAVLRASDVGMLRAVQARGGRLSAVPGDGRYIYLRHAGNTWRFTCGRHLDPHGWLLAPEPNLPEPDRAFYAGYSRALQLAAGQWPPAAPAVPRSPAAPTADMPLITCSMPTRDRRRFVPLAIHYFMCQDYPNRELIIADDGRDSVADLIPPDPRISYLRIEQPISLGAKRNLICEAARGSIVVHWDDDDWSAPHRLSVQAAALARQRADLAALSRTYHYQPDVGRAWLRAYPLTLRTTRDGGTLCYRRSLWQRVRFPNTMIGEDTRFVRDARAHRAALGLISDDSFYIAIIHGANTSWKSRSGPYWHPRPLAELALLMGGDMRFYASGGAL